jgi:hypothetical protein
MASGKYIYTTFCNIQDRRTLPRRQMAMIWLGLVAGSLTRRPGPILGQWVCIWCWWSIILHWYRYKYLRVLRFPLLSIISPTLDTHLPRSTDRITRTAWQSLGTLQQNSALSYIAAIFSLQAFRVTCPHILLFRIWKGNFILTNSELYSPVGTVTRLRSGRGTIGPL